jgi:hypothetical protein
MSILTSYGAKARLPARRTSSPVRRKGGLDLGVAFHRAAVLQRGHRLRGARRELISGYLRSSSLPRVREIDPTGGRRRRPGWRELRRPAPTLLGRLASAVEDPMAEEVMDAHASLQLTRSRRDCGHAEPSRPFAWRPQLPPSRTRCHVRWGDPSTSCQFARHERRDADAEQTAMMRVSRFQQCEAVWSCISGWAASYVRSFRLMDRPIEDGAEI